MLVACCSSTYITLPYLLSLNSLDREGARLLSPCGSQITTTTVAGAGYAMIMTRKRCLLVLEFFFYFFFDQGKSNAISRRSSRQPGFSRVDVVWVSVCVSSIVGWCSYILWCCIRVALYAFCMYPHLLCNVDVMISALQKRLQYALLSLVGPSSSFRIGSHLGRDKLVSEPRPTLGAPLIDRVVWPLLSLKENCFSESSYIGE